MNQNILGHILEVTDNLYQTEENKLTWGYLKSQPGTAFVSDDLSGGTQMLLSQVVTLETVPIMGPRNCFRQDFSLGSRNHLVSAALAEGRASQRANVSFQVPPCPVPPREGRIVILHYSPERS